MNDDYVSLCEAFFCKTFLVQRFYYVDDDVCVEEWGKQCTTSIKGD